MITLTATPAVGWYFAGWSGDTACAASAPTFTDEPPQADTKVFLPLLLVPPGNW